MNSSEIRFLTNEVIDRMKWDHCVDSSAYGIVYAKSWYLDRICKTWDALICGDYEYVMPLPWNRKYGIAYIYQPFFTQQLGIFSPHEIAPQLVGQFLNAIPKHFRLADINLNLGNSLPEENSVFRQNVTCHLDLNRDITEIRKAYKTNTQRNIRKAVVQNIRISPVADVKTFIDFTSANLRLKSPEIKSSHYAALQNVINYALAGRYGELSGAWDHNDRLLASVFFVRSNKTVIYLAASSNTAGIDNCAMFLLIDQFIAQNSGNDLSLDFEGSNIPGIARFYEGFGARQKIYYSVHQNRLPNVLKIFKK